MAVSRGSDLAVDSCIPGGQWKQKGMQGCVSQEPEAITHEACSRNPQGLMELQQEGLTFLRPGAVVKRNNQGPKWRKPLRTDVPGGFRCVELVGTAGYLRGSPLSRREGRREILDCTQADRIVGAQGGSAASAGEGMQRGEETELLS